MRYTKIFLGILSIVTLAFMGCDKEDYGIDSVTPTDPVVEGIIGIDSTGMGATGVSYSVEAPRTEAGSTYSWTVTGGTPSATEGDAITVSFSSGATSATISVTETAAGGATGSSESIEVELTPIAVAYETSLASGVALKDGDSDTLFLTFNVDLETLPTIGVVSGGGSFGTVTLDEDLDNVAFAIYTHAGGGDGAIDFSVASAEATSEYGGLTLAGDTASSVVTIDNTAPLSAMTIGETGVAGSSSISINPGVPVQLFVSFDELLDTTVDTLEYTVSGTGLEEVTLYFTTSDNEVYSAIYTPIATVDDTNFEDLALAFTLGTDLDEVIDLAGNESAGIGSVGITVDNVAPLSVINASAVEGTATGSIEVSADPDTDDDDVTVIHFVVLADGADAPETVSDFTDSFEESEGGKTIQFNEFNDYDVYFVAEDDAGNINLDNIVGPVDVTVTQP